MSTVKAATISPGWQTALRSVNWAELAVPLGVLSIVMAMVTPMPSMLLDVLISANITMSVVVLLAAMYINRPSDFSVFPTMLLLLTLVRLALNISSSRLILLQGNTGTRAAGEVIEAFGNFVVGGNYIVGVVIFLVLIAIQYVVINHGAVRISEVTARFTLDAMPGKQMSIDSDLNAGLINDTEARSRRKALAAEAEFYGAMDGASRFTQRDAIASIIITSINIVAGFLIGVFQHGVELQRALTDVYHSDHRRWAGNRHTGTHDFRIRRFDRNARQFGFTPRRRGTETNIQSVTASAFGLRRCWPSWRPFLACRRSHLLYWRWVPAHSAGVFAAKPQIAGDHREGNRREAEGGCRISSQNRASRN